MVRQSVLSAVRDERQQIMKLVGASDRAQLDAYFTSIRELENQLDVQLQKPEPNEACQVIPAPEDEGVTGGMAGVEIEHVQETHEVFARILAMAVACNQTRVFNMTFSESFSSLRREGETLTHHSLSHEERLDPETGLQPQTSWFNGRSMEGLAREVHRRLLIDPRRRRHVARQRAHDRWQRDEFRPDPFDRRRAVHDGRPRRRPDQDGLPRHRQRRPEHAYRPDGDAGHGPADRQLGHPVAQYVEDDQRHPRLG